MCREFSFHIICRPISLLVLHLPVVSIKILNFCGFYIDFLNIVQTISKLFRDKDFRKYARRKPVSLKDIKIADNWARLKTKAMCVR